MSELKNPRNYEIVTWRDIAEKVRSANQPLADLIDEIDPPLDWKIVKVCYAFGDELLQKGELFLPNRRGELVGINQPEFNAELYNLLNYQSMPVGLTLKSTMELFITHLDKVFPYNITQPGRVFGLWGGLDTEISSFHGKIWNMVAGCRSIFLLPKIADKIALSRMNREFKSSFQVPRSLWEHFDLFKQLCSHKDDPWYLEVIFFDKNWIRIDSEKQKKLRLFFLNMGWKSTMILRDSVIFDFVYSSAQAAKNIRIDPYLADTVKHLYGIGKKSYPGFIFAESDFCAPTSFIQKIFNDVYALEYSPTIMHLDYLNSNDSKSLFYSLNLPTLLEFSPRSRENSTNINSLYYIQLSIERLRNYILTADLNLAGQEIYKWARELKYNFYHSNPQNDQEIQSTSKLIKEESVLRKEEDFFKKPFCQKNIFMQGLVKLSNT